MIPLRRRHRVLLWVAALGAAGAALLGCPNSILRNAAEAGYETATDRTPTPTAQP